MKKIAGILLFVAVVAAGVAAAELKLETVSGVMGSTQETIRVTASNLPSDISGFKLAIAISDELYPVTDVRPGSFITTCQWDNFSYRVYANDPGLSQYDYLGRATSILEITGYASATGHTPTCLNSTQEIELATIHVLMFDECSIPEFQCTFLPVRFYWRSCGDNVFYSATSDTAYGALQLQDPGQQSGMPVSFVFPGFGIPDQSCTSVSGRTLVPALNSFNGGLDLICATGPECRGDLNLDGRISIADAVLYANYFAYGLSVFSPHVYASIAASDVNGDGIPLTLSDLAYLVRIINGDVFFYPSPTTPGPVRQNPVSK